MLHPIEHAEIEHLLGRKPQGSYEIVVRHSSGEDRVIRNDPFLDDGTPMPTLFWLVDPEERRLVSRLESRGAIKEVEALIGLDRIAETHSQYSQERNKHIPDGHQGPKPSGGVGGTRKGVKCLHAHYAFYLAGGDDPVGTWVAMNLQ